MWGTSPPCCRVGAGLGWDDAWMNRGRCTPPVTPQLCCWMFKPQRRRLLLPAGWDGFSWPRNAMLLAGFAAKPPAELAPVFRHVATIEEKPKA